MLATSALVVLSAFPAPAASGPSARHTTSSPGATSFSDPEEVSDGSSGFSHVDAADGVTHLVWDTAVRPREVWYRQSEGSSFGKAKNLTDNDGDSSESDLLIVGDTVHLVWEDNVLDRKGRPDSCCPDQDDVYYRRSTDGGDSFGKPVDLSDSKHRHSTDPDIAGSGDLVAVVFEEAVSEGNEDIFVRVSHDGGATWDPAVNLSDDEDRSAEPSVAVSGNAIHVLFEDRGDDADLADDRIVHVRSTDGGRTFTKPVPLPEGAERRGVVAVAGEVVHAAGCSRSDLSESELFAYRSSDGGDTWSEAENLSDNDGECHKPAIDAAGDLVVIAWQDTTPGEHDILVSVSTDGGEDFGSARNVSDTSGPSEDASLAIDPVTGDVHLVWTESPS